MNKLVQDIDKFHQTKKGRLIFGGAELVLAYIVISRAIHTGSIWQYLLFALLLIGGANNLIKAFTLKNNVKAKRKTSKS